MNSDAWGFRVKTVASALATAWLLCYVWLLGQDSGLPAYFHQPVAALVYSAATVSIALGLGLILKLPLIRVRWTTRMAEVVGLTALAFLLIGSLWGPTVSRTDPATDETATMLDPRISLPSYFALVFAIANRPRPAAAD
jgi:glucose uptake protein GlcU